MHWVDRCICTGVLFSEVLALEGDLRTRMLHSGAGLNCKHCRPFLREAITSGSPRVALQPDHPQFAVLVQHFHLSAEGEGEP
ncbi:hypothetical protein [Leeia sp.]|uniref:hypothetical protein n=1 Tax=Leeia sp. TaxID=2884678 RepID=UPI0035AFD7EE